jgi:hypothetical protein
MTLQKLVHRESLGGKESDDDTVGNTGSRGAFLRNFFNHQAAEDTADDFIKRHTEGVLPKTSQKLNTIQRYFGGHNHERAEYMERNSLLSKKSLAVSAEQVSIFLTAGKISNPDA